MSSTLPACRTCGAPRPYRFLRLGAHPPATLPVHPELASRPQPTFELDVHACLSCGLVQTGSEIPQELLDRLPASPRRTAAMRSHLVALAGSLAEMAGDGFLVHADAGDGLLLSLMDGREDGAGSPGAKVGAARNPRRTSLQMPRFDRAAAAEAHAAHGPADVIVVTDRLSRIDDLGEFMRAVDLLLADRGALVIETPHARDIMEFRQFDAFRLERLSTFSLLSIQRLAERFGMYVADARKPRGPRGPMRVIVRRESAFGRLMPEQSPTFHKVIAEERRAGMLRRAAYGDFASQAADARGRLVTMLNDLARRKTKLAACGASARGSTLLNHWRVGPSYLAYVADDDPAKQGLLTPGMLVPIVPIEEIARRPPDVLLILDWAAFEEIRERLASFVKNGGRFLLPLPEPAIVAGAAILEHV